jgi:hypothetical protein
MNVPLGLAPFADQSRTEHALVVAGGAVACLVGYVGAAAAFFGLAALGHGEPAGPQRVAGAFASLACWGFYALAFVRGKGGPVTDVLAYPVATVTAVPFAFRWAAFGPAWDALADRFGFFLFQPALFVDAAAHVVPGLVLCAGVLTAWASLLGEEAVADWQREHLSEPFREAFVDD